MTFSTYNTTKIFLKTHSNLQNANKKNRNFELTMLIAPLFNSNYSYLLFLLFHQQQPHHLQNQLICIVETSLINALTVPTFPIFSNSTRLFSTRPITSSKTKDEEKKATNQPTNLWKDLNVTGFSYQSAKRLIIIQKRGSIAINTATSSNCTLPF